MSQASTVRGSVYVGDGPGVNGSNTARLGHRQSSLSRASLLPSDSISQAGGAAGSGSTAGKVFPISIGFNIDSQQKIPQKSSAEKPGNSYHAIKNPEYSKLGILV
jgi:hypothetical protein